MASKPDFNLMVPVEYRDGKTIKARFIKFGAAWKRDNGPGFSCKIDFWPVGAGEGNRFMLLPPQEKDGADAGDDAGEYDDETGEVRDEDRAF